MRANLRIGRERTGVVDRIGVDFGTSHTVAVIGTTPLLFDSSPLLPSAVFADAAGRLLTGRDAYRSGQLDPGRWEPNPKRRVDEGTLLLGDREVPVADAIAAVLGRVATEAGRVLGGTNSGTTGGGSPDPPGHPAGDPAADPSVDLVLTHPAGWAGPRRAVLADAAVAAGFGRVRLVPEPVAAAAYFTTVTGHRVPPGSAVVVYDFGAGTFDVSVLRRIPAGGWEVVATDGLPDVGGLDLDAVVVDFVGARLTADPATDGPAVWARLTAPAGPVDHRHRRLLWEDARAVKEQLSREASATLVVPVLDRDVLVTRAEFEDLARPWLERTVNLTTATMFRSAVTADRLAGLFLVGGSSRIPLVATMLHRALGVVPVVLEQPELVVAQGSLVAVPPEPTAMAQPAPAAAAHAVPVIPDPADPADPADPDRPRLPPEPAAVPAAPSASGAGPARRWPVGLTVSAMALLVLIAFSEDVRPALFTAAGTVLRPATVLPFLATILLVAGARRTLPVAPRGSLWLGAVAGLTAATVLVAIVAVVAVVRPFGQWSETGRTDLGTWYVGIVGGATVVAGLGLLAYRGLADPERPGWRSVRYGILLGIVPGASGYTAVEWHAFARYDDLGPLAPALSTAEEAVTAQVVLGLAAGWVVAMTAAAFVGGAVGRATVPAGRRWVHRLGALVLAGAGAVLVRFVVDEREYITFDHLYIEPDQGRLGPVTRVWEKTVGAAHPGVLTGLLLVVTAAAYLVVRVQAQSRVQSQTRPGGS